MHPPHHASSKVMQVVKREEKSLLLRQYFTASNVVGYSRIFIEYSCENEESLHMVV